MIINPKVSIIVPIYNVERDIRKSIKSILNQTLKEIEVILINDGSTDHSGSIADEFAVLDNRIRVIHQENAGVSSARNKGIKIARGEYIGFVDPDDWIELEMFETLYKTATHCNCQVVSCTHFIENGQESIEYFQPFQNGNLLDEDKIKNQVLKPIISGELLTYCWDKIYKTSYIRNNDIWFPEKIQLWEDLYFCLEIFFKSTSFMHVSLPLYHYNRANQGTLSSKYYPNYLEMLTNLHKKKFEYIELSGMNLKTDMWMGLDCFFKDILGFIHSVCINDKEQFINRYRALYTIVNNETIKHYLNCEYSDIFYSRILTNNFYKKVLFFCVKRRNVISLFFWINLYNKILYPARLKAKTIQKTMPSSRKRS
ncbi:glycosyltransferase [Mesobacillus foraminis]|uniref:glycosyltransferase n=1 Tax=Mesobacillus foraminis TaxID=279826 RepID=UPI0039A1D339